MSIDIRYPNITAKDEAGQLNQVRSYLHQLVEQLNWAINNIEVGGAVVVDAKGRPVAEAEAEKEDPVSTFNSIKALIIKSADIVKAYYEQINTRLSGEYVAKSDFGVYTELTEQQIAANSTGIEQLFSNFQEIITDIESVTHTLLEVNAHIRSGLLYYNAEGVPVYGLEVGQRSEIDGVEVFNKYARFTSDKLAFYDSNDNEVAYISDKKLYITNVEVTGSITVGGFVDIVLTDKSVVTKWVGGA